MIGYVAWFPTSVGLKVVCWIFIIIPITVFTIYVYEPDWSRDFRSRVWARWRGRRSQDAPQKSVQPSGVEVPQTEVEEQVQEPEFEDQIHGNAISMSSVQQGVAVHAIPKPPENAEGHVEFLAPIEEFPNQS